jgi:hypothetical protein
MENGLNTTTTVLVQWLFPRCWFSGFPKAADGALPADSKVDTYNRSPSRAADADAAVRL